MSGDIPLISVVMATYNHEKYIAEAIQSILDQTFTDFELVIINDGSTDRTDEIIKTVKDARIVYIAQKNQGPSVAINNGILAARGKYIAYLDGDDVAYPFRLEKQYQYISSTSKKVAVFSWVDFINDDSEIISGDHFASNYFNHNNRTFAETLNYFFFTGNYFNACTNIIEKEALLEVGLYNLASIQVQDFDLWIKLLKKGYELFVMPEKLIKYRIRAGNKNLSADPDNLSRGLFEVHQLYRNLFDGVSQDLFREAFWNQIKKKNFSEGAEYELEKAFLYQNHSSTLTQSLAVEKLFTLFQDKNILATAISEYAFGLPELYKLAKQIDPTNTKLIWKFEAELAQSQSQLHQTEEMLEQSQSQLHETQEELTQSQSQLHQTEEILAQSQSQLHQTEEILEQSQSQLHQTEEMLEQSQSQLHETQEELTHSQSQLHETEEVLEQSQSQLHQTEKTLEQSQSQLHETQEELTHSQSQLHETEEVLEQSQSQLHHTQGELEQSQSQLHQTQGELEQSQSQLYQVQADLEEYHSQLNQVQAELEHTTALLNQSQAQLHRTEVVLEQSLDQQHQTQEQLSRWRFEQAIASQRNSPSQMQYELLVWDAWYAYQNSDLSKMGECLQQSIKCTPFSHTEIVLNWLDSFAKLSSEKGCELDTYSLTNSREWKQLLRPILGVKKITLSMP